MLKTRSRFHFDKYDIVPVETDKVYLLMSESIVLFQDRKTDPAQILCGGPFAGFSDLRFIQSHFRMKLFL